MRIKGLFFLALIFLLVGCTLPASEADDSQVVTVFAASSLTNAFSELADAFQAQNEDVEILLNFSGSSQLAAQISEGAAADVFAPANPLQMQSVIRSGRVEPGSESIFVSNRLTVVVPADNPAEIRSLEDLAQPRVQLILAVKGVPVRQYTDEIVMGMSLDFQERFYSNLVSEEDNVRQVSAKVALGEADAGIVYTSDVTDDLAGQIHEVLIPEEKNVVATYPIAPISDTDHPEAAEAFIEFVLSPQGQAILAKWGFGPPTFPGGSVSAAN